jgi:hypothetical protein
VKPLIGTMIQAPAEYHCQDLGPKPGGAPFWGFVLDLTISTDPPRLARLIKALWQ